MSKKVKTRLHYGVVLPSLDNTEKYNLLQDIENYALEHDINLTAYFGTYEAKNYGYASHYEPCFEAIKRNKALDGVIIYSGFIAHNIGTEKFTNYFNEVSKHIPIVSIGLQIPGTYCVMADNMAGMYNAVDHLIKEDGKKRIVFIKGPDGHPEAEARFSGYLKALSDNNIDRDDDLIFPGDFTPDSGRSTAEALTDKKKPIQFDAVAGCNDECALGVMRELKLRGFHLPRDASVIGFDDIMEAPSFKPPLSTVRQDFTKLGNIAADTLTRIIRKEKVDDVIFVAPELVIRRSCGCNKKERRKAIYLDNSNTHERIRRMVTDNLILEFNLESLGNLMRESLPAIALNFALVGVYHAPIDSNVGGDRSIDQLFGFDGEQKINIKYLDETAYPFADCTAIKGINFDSTRRSLFFLPLFFGDEERGAALIEYNSFNPINWYESLRTNIAAAVKGANLLEKIQALSVTDELTGLLNRRGFTQQVNTRLLFLQRETEYISAAFTIDMDGLKMINDTYGHAEGDKAIIAFAEILRESIRIGDISGRIGGDEFVVFTTFKAREDLEKLEARIRQKFDEYNAKKKHPYNVIGSIGTAFLSEPTSAAFDQAMLDADKKLYKEKQVKKKKGLSRG